mmetsp:Transcript_60518/g.69043  ORF Transcript_60518/g.69043 Transcript_60518/m.69043 type:complete len:460 (+) Transcript_60518:69-1448(+)
MKKLSVHSIQKFSRSFIPLSSPLFPLSQNIPFNSRIMSSRRFTTQKRKGSRLVTSDDIFNDELSQKSTVSVKIEEDAKIRRENRRVKKEPASSQSGSEDEEATEENDKKIASPKFKKEEIGLDSSRPTEDLTDFITQFAYPSTRSAKKENPKSVESTDDRPTKRLKKKPMSRSKTKPIKIEYESAVKSEDEDGDALKQQEAEDEESKVYDLKGGIYGAKRGPKDWQEILAGVKKLRSTQTSTPVDTMGSHIFATNDKYTPKELRFHTLVSLMMSSQTKDEINYAAMQRLLKHGLTPEKMLDIDTKDLQDLIYPVGFYRRKADYIKGASKIIVEKYSGDTPDTFEGLTGLPGVGPKMSHLQLQSCHGIVEGISVDVHMHRIFNRLKWVNNTKDPEQTRKAMQEWLPKPEWATINALFVGFGQTVCTPINPKCGKCPVSKFCPIGRKALRKGKKVERQETV